MRTILIWKNTASATIAAEDVHQHAKQFLVLWPVHLPNLPLKQLGISVTAYTSQVGPIKLDHDYKSYDLDLIESNDVRCPDLEKAKRNGRTHLESQR